MLAALAAQRSGCVWMSQSEDRRLPVVVPAERQDRKDEGVYTAHVFGQTERRRGLRGGRHAIDQAHSAYLGAEWSGPADRRRPAGRVVEDDA